MPIDALERLAHGQHAISEVYVGPPQPKQLATAKAKSERADPKRLETIALDRLYQMLCFLNSDGVDFLTVNAWRSYELRDIPVNQFLPLGVCERIANQCVHEPYRLPRER
jgi:hypothetical protein